ncbi:MAG: PD40 domain-containing protein, partial [Deltaproteobacteria bacterium]|nr:PD40 domain-containing protein [Deltaproteobacteria bacterium]
MPHARALAFAFALLLAGPTLAAEARPPTDEKGWLALAQKQYEAEQFEEAMKSYREAGALNPMNGQTWYQLALACEQAGKSDEVAGALGRAVGTYHAALAKDDANGDLWYSLGLVHEHQGNLKMMAMAMQKAVERIPKMAKSTATISEAQNRLMYANESQLLRLNTPSAAMPVNLGPAVNSPADETFPQLAANGRRIYFTSKRAGGLGGEDLYYADLTDAGGWTAPTGLPPPINTKQHDGAATFSPDGSTVIFTGCGRPDSLGSCDLYSSELNGTVWDVPRPLGPVVNSTSWEGQPALSPDQRTLVFASRRPGGFGKSDLWITHKDAQGLWGPPANLGPTINTPMSEQSPSFAPDGKTLYFASSGHPGFGRMDIFKTVFEEGKWSTPVNLGAPINTDQDEKFFTVGGKGDVGYFASKRPGGQGGYDLYSIEMQKALQPEPTLIVTGKVADARTNKPMAAGLIIQELRSGELVSNESSNSATGKYMVVLPQGKTYAVSVSHPGYFFYSSKFEVPKGAEFSELTKDISLLEIKKGVHVVLHNVFFETGSAELSPDSQLELKAAAELLSVNPKLVVEIGGHTDNVGKP